MRPSQSARTIRYSRVAHNLSPAGANQGEGAVKIKEANARVLSGGGGVQYFNWAHHFFKTLLE